MARQSKKIAKKIQPKKKVEVENKKPEKPKVGRDYLLVIVLALTIVFLLVGWQNFTVINRALYISLLVSLSTTYAKRHYNFTEKQEVWLDRAGLISMGCAIVLFVFVVYQQYFAS